MILNSKYKILIAVGDAPFTFPFAKNKRMRISLNVLIISSLFSFLVRCSSLQEMYNNAQPYGDYNKLIILQNGSIYTGGFIQDVGKVCIQGNGAIIDLVGENIVVDGEKKEILIHHCIFISSAPYETYVLLKNNACGHFINNTFYSIADSIVSRDCLRFEECTTSYSTIYNNIFVNFNSAVYFYTMDYTAPIALNISNNDVWDCNNGYMFWGGWTGDASTFVPSPGNSEIIDDPRFVDPSKLNFNLQLGSPCINRGTNYGYDFQSYDPDLGAKESGYTNFIGTKLSGTLSGDLIADNSPYIIEDDIIIPTGSKLKVFPGTVLKINTSKSILVYGSLVLEGTDSDSIYIQQNSIYKTHWGGITFYSEATNQSSISRVSMSNGAPLNGKGIIYCSNDSITICNNYFSNMSTSIYCDSNSYPNISNNIFKEVSGFTGVTAIYCAPGSKPIISNNEFYCSSVYCKSAKPIIKRNKFMGQTYSVGQQYWLLTLLGNSDVYLEANLFKDNYGAVEVISSACSSYNNLLYNCETSYLFTGNAFGRIYNNTIFTKYTGLSCSENSTVNIINSIAWRFGSYGYALGTSDSSKIYPDCCILSDQYDGGNTIYEDPLFVNFINNDFHLSIGSPAINAGTIDTTGFNIPQSDYDNKERIIDGRIDIGCYEFTDANSVSNLYHKIPVSYCLEQNFPNPFNPSTTISFSIPSKSFVSLKMFNIIGREVAIIVSEEMPAGNYSKQWNAANMSSGIYFYRLQAGSYSETKKLVLLK